MISYRTLRVPIRPDLEASHRAVWESLATPGAWWDSAARIAIAAAARNARIEAGLAEGAAAAAETAGSLPDSVRRLARELGGETRALDRAWYEKRVPAEVDEAQYVEALGVVVRTTCVDVFHRGVGAALPDYPAPGTADPSRLRPAHTAIDVGWVSMIQNGAAGGEDGKALWGDGPQANVVRALSLVPDEVRGMAELSAAQYVEIPRVIDARFDPGRAIERAQIELVAGRVSALNECFY